MDAPGKFGEPVRNVILGFYTIPRDTKDKRHSDHVGVPNKTNNQNSLVKSTSTWPL